MPVQSDRKRYNTQLNDSTINHTKAKIQNPGPDFAILSKTESDITSLYEILFEFFFTALFLKMYLSPR